MSDQTINWNEAFTQNALDARKTAMNQKGTENEFGPNGSRAYQQALKHSRMIEILDAHEGDELIDVDAMFANADAWIAEQLEEDPELFDPQFSPEAFEAIPEDVMRGKTKNILFARFEGRKNVHAEEITDELIDEVREEADPRENVERDGDPVACTVCERVYHPESWDDSKREGRRTGQFHAKNGGLLNACSTKCKRDASEAIKAATGHWPAGWETRGDAETRQTRQANAIAQKEVREAEKSERIFETLGISDRDDATTRVRKTMDAIRRRR